MKKQLLIALLLGLSTTICHSQVKINVQGGTGLTGITKNENYNANFGYRLSYLLTRLGPCKQGYSS